MADSSHARVNAVPATPSAKEMLSHPSGWWREIKMETYSSELPRALAHTPMLGEL